MSDPLPAPSKTARYRKPVLIGVAAVVVVLILHAWWMSYLYVSTDDAFIESHVATISAKLATHVDRVAVEDNQEVRKGDLLVQLDSRDFQAKQLEANANFLRAEADFNRITKLRQGNAISDQDVETARANRDVAKARLDQSTLDLSHTIMQAPYAGRVTRKQVEPGNYVQPGQTLLSVVSPEVWVVANFKETQLTHMQAGQKVEVEVDAYPGKTLKAHVDSFQAGTGARFSLLPAENATGNYVKVVQRIPVKIVFDEPLEALKNLTPGLTVVPTVKVR